MAFQKQGNAPKLRGMLHGKSVLDAEIDQKPYSGETDMALDPQRGQYTLHVGKGQEKHFGRRRVDEKERKVTEIMAIMVSGQYVTHLTPIKMAAEWGCEEASVRHCAAEASRRIKAEVHGNPELRGRIIAMLEVIAAQSLGPNSTAPDRRTAIEALRLLSYVTGAAGGDVSPSKTNVTVNVAAGARIDSVVLDAMYGPPRINPNEKAIAEASRVKAHAEHALTGGIQAPVVVEAEAETEVVPVEA